MIDKELIKTIIAEGISRGPQVPRDIRRVDIDKIYTIIGPRRAGKTYFLFQIIDDLLKKGTQSEQIFYLNFEDERLENIETEDLQTIISAFYELYPENRDKKVYFMFDEIQNAPSWSKFVRRLYDKKNCGVYVTGSSAKLLSREIATELRGRTWTYEIFPFSFKEYLRSRGIELKKTTIYSEERFQIKKHFEDYLLNGGFPEVAAQEPFVRCRILQNYFELVMFRDVIERYSVSSVGVVKDLFLYLANNFSRPFSINKYYRLLKSQNRKVSKDTLYELERYIEDTMYFYFVPVHSSSQKVRMVNLKKVYIIDNGLAHCLYSKATRDVGWFYENLVFVELMRRGYELSYHQNEYECDFIAVKGKEKLPVQVSLEPENERELLGLLEAMDKVSVKEGLFLTKDTEKTADEKGKKVNYVPLWKWLLQ